MAVWLACVFILLLRQLPSDYKDGVALLLEGGQEGSQVEQGQRLWCREEGVEVPELAIDAPDGEPVFLHQDQLLQLSR